MARAPSLILLVGLQAVISAASLVVEIVAGRMLAPHVGMSLYTWTSVIAVVLAGFSAGHWWGGRLADRPAPAALRATGYAMLWAALTTASATLILQWVAGPVLGVVGHPVWGITSLTMLAFFLPSFFAGVPAPVLAQVALTASAQPGQALGAMFASGAIGAIAGTLLAGFVFLSWIGSVWTLAVVTGVYIISAALFFWMARPGAWVLPSVAAVLAVGLGVAAVSAPNPCTRETRYFCVRVIDMAADPARPVNMMVIDHLVHGISARDLPEVQFTDHGAMLDRLAQLRAPRPDFSAFFIGGGSFSVPRSLGSAGAGQVTVAEIDPEVTEIAADSFWFDPTGAEVFAEDARVALARRPERRYDIILGDAFTDIAMPAHLVTREFFELARDRLTPEGSYLMNVIDFEDRRHALGAIVATLQTVFPVVEVWTRAEVPAPGSRMVFVLAAGQARTPVDSFVAPAPELAQFAALSDGFVARLVAEEGRILIDDLAPIDRLIGRPD